MAAKASVQQYLKINEIKDGIVALKDGSVRSVILVSSMNFALRSEDEKNAIIGSFQSFVNAINFPLQILVRSKRLDLDDYLKDLDKRASEETNQLLSGQISDYTDFIKRMLEVVNIMDKDFYVIVPYYPPAIEPTGIASKLFSKVKGGKTLAKSSFEQSKTELLQRVDQISSGISSLGLRSAVLDTEELIELFYSIYNPSLEKTQKVTDVGNLGASVIQKGSGGENA